MATFLNLFTGSYALLTAIPGVSSWRLYLQKDAKDLSAQKRDELESKIKELAGKLSINKPVELIEIKGCLTLAQAQGGVLLPGKIGIAIDPEVVNETSSDELEFILAHELSHIKANDIMWMGITSGIAGLIATLAMSVLFPSSAAYFPKIILCTLMVSSPASVVGVLVSLIAFTILSRWREECADKLALSVCSDAAKKAASSPFEKIRLDNIDQRNHPSGSTFSRLLIKLLITKDGNNRSDILHPSLTYRISYLRPKNT